MIAVVTDMFPTAARLRELLSAASTIAHEAKALYTYDSQNIIIHDKGVDFVVRISNVLKHKPTTAVQQQQHRNDPFTPPFEHGLFIGELSSTHLWLFNKYNVVNNHTLVVTRQWEQQGTPLNVHDMMAWWSVITAQNGYGFYNAGEHSGASQPHKHMQVVPGDPPMASVSINGALPFKHAISVFNDSYNTDPLEHGTMLVSLFKGLLKEVGMPQSYSVLLARDYLLIVRRTKAQSGPISINSVAFAGTFFVTTEEGLQYVKEYGPMALLTDVVEEGVVVEDNTQ